MTGNINDSAATFDDVPAWFTDTPARGASSELLPNEGEDNRPLVALANRTRNLYNQVNDRVNQGVKTTDSPTFANATITTQLNADNVEANNISAKVGNFRDGTTGTVHSNLVKSTVSVETPFVKTDEVITSAVSVDVSGTDLTLQANSSHSVVLNSPVKIGGSSAPAIKQKLITGTTGAKNGYSLTPHGLDWLKTISFSVIVYTADNKYALPCDILSSGVHWYDALLTDTNIQIWVGADADNAASRPFKCLITYSE